jgi:hypothetical protein
VTNAQFPDAIRTLRPITQLYVSVDAPNKEALEIVDRPLFSDAWERLRAQAASFPEDPIRCRKRRRKGPEIVERVPECEQRAPATARRRPQARKVHGMPGGRRLETVRRSHGCGPSTVLRRPDAGPRRHLYAQSYRGSLWSEGGPETAPGGGQKRACRTKATRRSLDGPSTAPRRSDTALCGPEADSSTGTPQSSVAPLAIFNAPLPNGGRRRPRIGLSRPRADSRRTRCGPRGPRAETVADRQSAGASRQSAGWSDGGKAVASRAPCIDGHRGASLNGRFPKDWRLLNMI